jgi:predicted regulator of Ras-like GTPase activity (Roadblock/LC7/MglB family)
MSKIDNLLQQVRTELGPDFLSSDVVGMDGLSIGGLSSNPDFDSDAASARFAMIMRLAERVADRTKMGAVDDSLVTATNSYIISRFIGDGSYYWGLAVSRNAVLGMVRMLMDEYADQLWAAVPR